jgi:hypothetical protein
MSTAIRSSFVDHTGLDGTGDAINGNEVDENPNVVADILDGTLATDLAGAGTLDFVMTDTRAGIRLIDLSNAAAAIHEGLVLEWDPGDGGNLTDNSSGIGIDFKLPDDADAQTVFGSLNVVCVDDAAASTDGEFSFRVTAAGTDNVEQMTLSAAALTVVPNIIGTIDGTSTLADGVVATTQSASDNSTKVATTAYVDALSLGADLGTANTWTADQTFNDNVKVTLGTGGDADLYYDATNVVLNPKVVGSGVFNVLGNMGVGIARTDGTLHVHTASAGVVTAATTADDLVVEHAVEGGISILGGATVDSHLTMGASNDNAGFDLQYNHTSGAMKWSISGSDEALTATGARWGIRETTNANQAIGLTINQLTQDDEILAFKSSDVAHGMTDETETDTYGLIKKNNAGDGGLRINTHSGGGIAMHLYAAGSEGSTTKSTAGVAPHYITATKKSGTSVQSLGANENLLVITNAGTTRFIFDADGDSHQDVGTAWTNFDAYEDVAITRALGMTLSPETIVQTKWDDWGKANKDLVYEVGLMQRLTPEQEAKGERSLVNMTTLAKVHNGAIGQLYASQKDLELMVIEELEQLKAQVNNLLMERN